MTRHCQLPLLAVLVVLAALAGCAHEASKAPPATTSEPPAPPPAVAQEQRPAPPPPTARPSTPSLGVVVPVVPTTVPPPSVKEFVDHPALKDVFFESRRADIGRQGAAIMGSNVRWLLDNPDHLVLVEGHTDSTGSREGNLVIAQRRAMSVVSFLVESGIPSGRLHTVTYGSDRPVCRDRSEACAAKHRRAHFRVKRQ